MMRNRIKKCKEVSDTKITRLNFGGRNRKRERKCGASSSMSSRDPFDGVRVPARARENPPRHIALGIQKNTHKRIISPPPAHPSPVQESPWKSSDLTTMNYHISRRIKN